MIFIIPEAGQSPAGGHTTECRRRVSKGRVGGRLPRNCGGSNAELEEGSNIWLGGRGRLFIFYRAAFRRHGLSCGRTGGAGFGVSGAVRSDLGECTRIST